MVTLIKILIAVYLVAVNVYAFFLMRLQKTQALYSNNTTVKDGKLLLVGIMGGALGIFISAFILSYRRDSMFIMIVMPLLIALTVYLTILGILGDFSFFQN